MNHSFGLLAAMAITASVAVPAAVPSAARETAADFYAYTLPLLEVARRREAALAQGPANSWRHDRTLADARFRAVTTPNNDTLYSMAFLDLSVGPVTISVPAGDRRYVSLHLMDAWSNAIGFAGTRVSGGRAESVTVVGPETAVPSQGLGRVVRSPTRWVWAIARVLVTSPADLAAARQVQDGFAMRVAGRGGTAPAKPDPAPADDAAPDRLRAAAVALFNSNPPPAADNAALARFRAAGLLDGRIPADDLAAGFAQARRDVRARRRPGQVVNGWIYPKANLGDYGTDYAYRASVAVNGLGAMVPAEAMYLRSAAPTPTGLFDGRRAWRLHFAADALPPVDGFWSLSMYEHTADGGYYFVENAQSRYAIGDRTPGLARNADGSLDLWIGHADPGATRRANWLPAPDGPFALSLRAYLPRAALRDGTWRAPAVQPVK